MRRLTWSLLAKSIVESAITTGMIFMIIIGGHLIARFFVLTDVTTIIVDAIAASGLGPMAILGLFTLMYLVLGALLDVWGLLILTLPFVFPIVMALGFDPVWFGI